MPEFYTGEEKIALVPVTNPTAKAFDYEAVLYMGTDLAIMAQVPFHLEAGESKTLSMSVTMPSVAGTYPVHIGVFSGGQSIALYRATEDVVLVASVLLSIQSFVRVVNSSLIAALGDMNYQTGAQVSHLGFYLENGGQPVSGVSVKCFFYHGWLGTTKQLLPPYDRFLQQIPQPFTVPSGTMVILFIYGPFAVVSLDITHVITAEAYIDDVLVDTQSMAFTIIGTHMPS